MYDAHESASVPQLPRTIAMTRLHFKEIASLQNKAPTHKHPQRRKRSRVVVELWLLVGLRSSLLNPET